MKIVDDEDSRHENFNAWNALEEAIHSARNMAFLLTAAVEQCDEFYGDDKREAVAFGVFEVEDRIKKIREAWRATREEVRTIRSEGEETRFCDDEGNNKKIVNLH